MRKADITTRGGYLGSRPAVNVKVYRTVRDLDTAGWQDVCGDLGLEGLDFGPEWLEAHLDDDACQVWHDAACEDGFETAQNDAAEVFGQGVRCWQDGRSGGWLVIVGLPDVESWDVVAVAKWARFVRWCEANVADIPRATAWLIGANVYEPALVEFQRLEELRNDVMADALAAHV